MISAILNLVTGGVATYKQLNQNKAEALKRKDELENEKHQVEYGDYKMVKSRPVALMTSALEIGDLRMNLSC